MLWLNATNLSRGVAELGTTHQVSEDLRHDRFDPAIPPVLTIAPGDTVVFETPDALNNQFGPESASSALANLDFSVIHQISGPIAIEGAEPGDTLIVEILSIEPKQWGWSGVVPNFGLLQMDPEYQEPYLHHWDLSSGKHAAFDDRIRVPFEPFCGVMAVAPISDEPLITLPPRANGGNMDLKQAQPGSKVFFPVFVPGANFSLGDVHAAQGDGEICGTGIECQATVTARFDLRKGHPMPEPAIMLPGKMPGSQNDGWMVTTAHGPDLMENARNAVRYMVGFLVRTEKLSPQEAYVLCSACADLKIGEIVDAPNWIVTCSFPLGVLGGRS